MPMGKGQHPGANSTYKGTLSPKSSGLSSKIDKAPMSKDVEDWRNLRPSGDPIKPPSGRGVFLPPKEKTNSLDTPGGGEDDVKYMRRAADSLSSRTTKYQGMAADPGPNYGKKKGK